MAIAGNYNDWLLDRAKMFVGRRVLDFGAGTGTFTARLATHAEVVAVEPDPTFVMALQRRFAGNDRITVVESDSSWLADPVRRNTFDTVLCFNVLEHIADDAFALEAFRNCLTERGHVLLLVPAHSFLFGAIDRSVGHERRYSRNALLLLLANSGFEPIEVRYVNPLGAVGWLISSQLLRLQHVPSGPLRAYDRLVPALRCLDHLRLPFGLSVWAVARASE